MSGSLLTTSGTPKSPFFGRYWSWFPKKHDFFSFFGKFTKKWTLACPQHPDFTYSLFRKHLFRKVANVSNSLFSLIFMLLDRDHYPNFKFWFFRNFWSLKTLPLQFRTDSFWLEWIIRTTFLMKILSKLRSFQHKSSSNGSPSVEIWFCEFSKFLKSSLWERKTWFRVLEAAHKHQIWSRSWLISEQNCVFRDFTNVFWTDHYPIF